MNEEEEYKDLGIWTAMNLDFTREANEAVGKMIANLNNIKDRRITVHQKIRIINYVFIPSVIFRMRSIVLSSRALREIDRIVGNTVKQALKVPRYIKSRRLYARTNYGGWNLLSVEHLQKRLEDNKKITEKGKFNRFYRKLSKAITELKIELIDTKGMPRFKPQLNEQQRKVILRNNNQFTRVEGKIVIASDGSANKEVASCGVAMNEESIWSINQRVIGIPNSYNAELQGLELALLMIPENESSIILLDNMAVIKVIEKFDEESTLQKIKNPYIDTIVRINGAVCRRQAQGATTELIWVPSHTKDRSKENLSERKRQQLVKLEERFGERYEDIINLNAAADKAADWKKAASKPKRRWQLLEGIPRWIVTRGNKMLLGNIYKRLLKHWRRQQSKQIIQEAKYNNMEEFQLKESNIVMMHKKYKWGKTQEFLFRLRTNTLYLNERMYKIGKSYKEIKNFYQYRTQKCTRRKLATYV